MCLIVLAETRIFLQVVGIGVAILLHFFLQTPASSLLTLLKEEPSAMANGMLSKQLQVRAT